MSLNMLPVYRASEGVENLEHNYNTFEKCKEIFKQNGIVLIFSEGKCVNEWHLRKLMKGAARLAISSWQDDIPLKVLPAGINYSSFRRFGKNIQLNFGKAFSKEVIDPVNSEGKNILSFNDELQKQLKELVIEIAPANKEQIKQQFNVEIPAWKKVLLFIPAITGAIIHAPLYFPVQQFTWNRTSKNDHYDSVMVGMLFILYPFFLMLTTFILFMITKQAIVFLLLLILPFMAWCSMQLKRQF